MQRLFRLSLLALIMGILGFGETLAQPKVEVSGEIAPGQIRIFVKDSLYRINREYKVFGTLIIEPGTTVKFMADGGKLVVEPGGRVLADGDAETAYEPNPDGIDPVATPGSPSNPYGWDGYSDLDYFLYVNPGDDAIRTITVDTERDITVHEDNYDHIFNVILDKNNRRVLDLEEDHILGNKALGGDQVKIPFESAIMFKAARMGNDPDDDINLRIRQWRRVGNKDVPIGSSDPIRFLGQPIGDFSREWGHIVVLPGARAAFFRNCTFEGFRKDTVVDRGMITRGVYYGEEDLPSLSWDELQALNNRISMMSNGSGGAITTFSARTWLLNCEFKNNQARYRGGALQILESPEGYPTVDIDGLGYYDVDKNPNITNRDGSISTINAENPIPAIDLIDEPGYDEPLTCFDRQAWDDGRYAVYLGRMRNLTFDGNKVLLANVKFTQIGNLKIVEYDLDNPADYPQMYGDHAYGGAIYIAGNDENSKMEVAFGLNNSVKIAGEEQEFDDPDTFEATGNECENYQGAASTKGSRGGAIYLGAYTSLLVAGDFSHNRTYVKFLQDEDSGTNSGYYSMGGAIFEENTYGRLQVRGGPNREVIGNQTHFYQNTSGAGGAIYVDGNVDPQMSPIIGGSDMTVGTRDYGFNIMFDENEAISWGGAVLSKRNMLVNGAGGVVADELIGYGGKYPVRFWDNKAGYAGGAVSIQLPNDPEVITPEQRLVHLVRAEFRDNIVGEGIRDLDKPEIRGGGAVYSLNGDLNLVKAVEFRGNKVYNGNGGAVCLVHPMTSQKRYFLTDLDHEYRIDGTCIVNDFDSENDVFIFDDTGYPPDQRMMTRFLDNVIEVDPEILESQSGSGTTQVGVGTMPSFNNLYATTWIDNNNGYAVGYNGSIVKLTQGGTEWEHLSSGTPHRLNDVFFTSSDVGYAVGGVSGRPDETGVLLRTRDGGLNWEMISTPVSKAINDVTFIGTNVGFAVCDDGYILRTTNGGDTWTSSRPETADLNGVYFTGVNKGFVVGERGLVLVTDDGGINWDVRVIPGVIVNLNNVMFVDANTGYIAGNAGFVIKTDNGGDSWMVIDVGVGDDLYSTYFTNISTGYVVGTNGAVLGTVDGGTTWAELPANTSYNLYDVFFPSRETGYIVGDAGLLLGTTDEGQTWLELKPADESDIDVVRWHQEIMLPENGVGLGGALFVLDSVNVNRVGRQDSIFFNRVRMQGNKAYTGAAIYSDNFDMKLIFNRSLITSNMAYSDIGMDQNAITGAVVRDDNDDIEFNMASHDLAGAIIYGEIQGPLPNEFYSEAANSIYDNDARFLIRLPDAPNTKGVLAGTTGVGFGGTDTLRGNYWGLTEADVDLIIDNNHAGGYEGAVQETFFVEAGNENQLWLEYTLGDDLRAQGPFESRNNYSYEPIPLSNVDGDENTPADKTIPEMLLFSGKVYDAFDKGLDIKVADYSKRRMSPIEDFAVGIPPILQRFNDEDDADMPSNGKYVKRWVRDPFVADSLDDQGDPVYGYIGQLQDEFRPNGNGEMWHPIGYPLYLESMVDYEGLAERSNFDPRTLNESVFFIINETTGDFIRVNMKQVSNDAPYRETFRARVELVPDSSLRNPNTLLRRTSEGLLNLGTGDYLLRQLEDNPYKEDRATLIGRKYDYDDNGFGMVPDLYKNRPSMPAANNGLATYYAGEKYRALPVDTGDVVRIISRTVLWKEGVIPAYDDGIEFKVVRQVEPPIFTGNVVKLMTDTASVTKIVPSDYPWKDRDTLILTEFLNTIHVTEDREYPASQGWYSEGNAPDVGEDAVGRDSILTVTAIDTNSYYDPRSLLDMFLDDYPQLKYNWIPTYPPDHPMAGQENPNSGLRRWLMVDTITAGEDQFQNPRDDALGYIQFRGKPTNPFVVPGGEYVSVFVENFPPHWRTIDELKKLNVGQDSIDVLLNLFGPYLSTPEYMDLHARYLQQDTIDVGGPDGWRTDDYFFRIFVVDSVPRFLDPGTASSTVTRDLNTAGDTTETYVVYEPSVYTCDQTDDGKLKANVSGDPNDDTYKLRFQADFNTDDEAEDEWAVIVDQRHGRTPWDFRFGRTAYGFMNRAIRADEDVIIDSTIYDKDQNGREDDTVITQVRPIWMVDDYLHEYGDGQVDPPSDTFGFYFTRFGQLDIRIPGNEAIDLLTPAVQYNGALNTDTVFTVVVNDGHGGINYRQVPVFINIQPKIITDALPAAKEDVDYNPQLLDSLKMIQVDDPNFGQEHTFELIYANESRDEIPRDPCYPEAGAWDLTGLKTTPDWLQINPQSGLLYGTPTLTVDNTYAPKTEQITVVVTDADGLTDIKTISLRVDSTNHKPHIDAVPVIRCVDLEQPYEETIYVSDLDLFRDIQGEEEELTITVEEPTSGIEVEPSTITGFSDKDTIEVRVYSDNLQVPPGPDGKITIRIKVSDGEDEYIYEYKLRISEETHFVCDLMIENNLGAMETLQFGTAPKNATTGDGLDGEEIGTIDSNFCEYELPPLPPLDVFDARWMIPTRNGILRSIFPEGRNEPGQRAYRGQFQAGGEDGNTSVAYPVVLSWDKTQIPGKDDTDINPPGSSWYIRDAHSNGNIFNINMKEGDGLAATYIEIVTEGDICKVMIKQNAVDKFIIIHDWISPVQPIAGMPTEVSIVSVSPNPFDKGEATIHYGLPKADDIRIEVIDALGNVVATPVNGSYQAGYHVATWNGSDANGNQLASGTYTVLLTAEGVTSAYPVIIIK